METVNKINKLKPMLFTCFDYRDFTSLQAVWQTESGDVIAEHCKDRGFSALFSGLQSGIDTVMITVSYSVLKWVKVAVQVTHDRRFFTPYRHE